MQSLILSVTNVKYTTNSSCEDLKSNFNRITNNNVRPCIFILFEISALSWDALRPTDSRFCDKDKTNDDISRHTRSETNILIIMRTYILLVYVVFIAYR